MKDLPQKDLGSREAKHFFIQAFFESYARKAERVKRIQKLDMPEESITLACCYLAALAGLRYDERRERDSFVRLLATYSGHADLLMRISVPFLLTTGRDSSDKSRDGKGLSRFRDIVNALGERFGSKADHRDEIQKGEMIDWLQSRIGSIDRRNLEANLDRFSYAAYLYEVYRYQGVHRGGMGHRYDVETELPIFPPNLSGEPVYYDDNQLQFSIDFLVALFEETVNRLAAECLDALRFPNEL